MTLMEVMVAIGILVLVLLIGIPAFRSGQEGTKLKVDARALLGDLRLAQQLTVGEQTTYLVKIFSNPNKYQLLRRTATDTIIKERPLTGGIIWQATGGFTNNEIVFTTAGAVVEAGTVVLQNTTNNENINVEIKPSGYVRVN